MARVSSLVYLAGETAFSHIQDRGLSPGDIRVIAGAAGGPKGLILSGLDRALFTDWFHPGCGRTAPLYLLGNSIAAWRFASLSQPDPGPALDRMLMAYRSQNYVVDSSPSGISREARRMLAEILPEGAAEEILRHPFFRLSFMADRARGWAAADKGPKRTMGMAAAVGLNAMSRSFLRHLFTRALFHDPRDPPPYADMSGFPLQRMELTPENLKPALLASGAIPMVMNGVSDIPGARAGVYYDGGLIDYHLDLPLLPDGGGIVLYPHFLDRIIPGWLDKYLPWRRADAENLKHTLLVTPSPEFVAGLPGGKIPDRTDFVTFHRQDARRRNRWAAALRAAAELGYEFLEDAESGAIAGKLARLVP